jgi:ornithine cyclodeaminase/alanine dehydrogenase
MKPQGTLLLSRKDIEELLDLSDYIEVVENAFRAYAMGETLSLGLLHVDTPDGEFHIKAGGVKEPRVYCGLKMNGGFFKTRAGSSCPTSREPSPSTTARTGTRRPLWTPSRPPSTAPERRLR